MKIMLRKILFIYILIAFIFPYSWGQEPHKDVELYVSTWITNNKDASKETIIHFLDTYLPVLTTVDDTYYVLINIINSYPTEKLPYTIYLLFAQISSLKLDFVTASLMYYTTFTLTDNYKHLVQAAVQEYQIGHIEKANSFLDQVFQNEVSTAAFLTAVILKSEIILLQESANSSLEFLDRAQYQVEVSSITPSYLYQVYRIANLTNNSSASDQVYRILQERFPNSIELHTINSASVSPLPLPSLLFSKVPNIIPDTENLAPTENDNDSVLFSTTPNVGYQVGSYSKLSNATVSLQFFMTAWKKDNFFENENIIAPVLTQKKINDTLYYQIIFPLDSEETLQQQQTLFLKSKGIEGFIVHQ